MRQLHLDCADVNARGRHVYEKAGFVLEGHDRDSSTDRRRDPDTGVPLHSTPVRSGMLSFAILRSEYAKLAGVAGLAPAEVGEAGRWVPMAPGEPVPMPTLTPAARL